MLAIMIARYASNYTFRNVSKYSFPIASNSHVPKYQQLLFSGTPAVIFGRNANTVSECLQFQRSEVLTMLFPQMPAIAVFQAYTCYSNSWRRPQ